MRGVGTLVGALLVLAAAAPAASADALHFTTPRALSGTLPGSNHRGGGEPSAVFDQDGSPLYVATPGAPDMGGNFWRSLDGGKTFDAGKSVGTAVAGGGDSDVAVGYDPQHTVFYIDLETLVASDLCRSFDKGQTFTADNCSTGFPTNQPHAAVDRPWVNTVAGHPGLVYATYDGLAFGGGAPEVQQSMDNGSTFTPCGQVLEPGSDAFAHFSPTGALENSEVIGKSAIGSDGSIYVPFTEPHVVGQQATLASDPTPSNLYVGIGRGGCPNPASTFHDVTVFQNDEGAGSDFVAIFPNIAIDGGGNLYMLAAGRLTGDQKGDGVYLFVSRDKGETWSKPPIKVNSGPPEAAQLPALAGGLGNGQALIGWYSSSANPDHNSAAGQWRYHVAQTFDFGQTFTKATVTPGVFHYGAVCNLGIECTGGRELLDFTSVAVNPKTGCGFAVFAGDPYDTPQNQKTDPAAAYTSVQDGGTCLTTAAQAGPNGGTTKAKKPKRHLQLSVKPRRTETGCRIFTFTTTTRTHGKRRVVKSATVTFAGKHKRSDRHGHARIRRCFERVGRQKARATKSGYTPASTTVRIAASPHFTG